MERRQFLVRSAAVGGVLMGRRTSQFARQNLGLWTDTSPPERVLSRADGVDGTIADVAETTVALDVSWPAPRDSFDVLVRRREYPDGAVLGSAASGQIHATDEAEERTVTVTIPRAGRQSGAWFYEAFVRTSEDETVEGFLCESAPLRWCPKGEDRVTTAERVSEPKPAVDGTTFSRIRANNEYELSYQWTDTDRTTWSFEYKLRRSLYDAAVARERGYTTTYEESLSSSIAQDFAATLLRGATTENSSDSEDGDSSSRTPASLDAGRRFDVLVTFVQALRYAPDSATLAAYDYHRTNEETLVAGVGDCKDRTYLLAGLLSAAFDCETTLLFQTGHVLLGVDIEDVPSLPYEVDTLSLGGREYLAIDPSLRGPIDAYPDFPFVAAYDDEDWWYTDTDAITAGIDDVVRDYLEKADVVPQVF